MREPIVIHSPISTAHLVLLFHGVGSTAQNLVPLGQQIVAALPQAAVISVPSPDACEVGPGYQWFSVRGITESNRVQRVADAMPRFIETVKKLQLNSGVAAAQTTLIGFSQGGIMALESSQISKPLAGSIFAIAGRFAQLPQQAPASTRLHLIHGESDPVIASSYSVAANERLRALGADVTVDLIPSLGHGINQAAVERLVGHLAGDIDRLSGVIAGSAHHRIGRPA
jgi:phospholipase/carboxylesterase